MYLKIYGQKESLHTISKINVKFSSSITADCVAVVCSAYKTKALFIVECFGWPPPRRAQWVTEVTAQQVWQRGYRACSCVAQYTRNEVGREGAALSAKRAIVLATVTTPDLLVTVALSVPALPTQYLSLTPLYRHLICTRYEHML